MRSGDVIWFSSAFLWNIQHLPRFLVISGQVPLACEHSLRLTVWLSSRPVQTACQLYLHRTTSSTWAGPMHSPTWWFAATLTAMSKCLSHCHCLCCERSLGSWLMALRARISSAWRRLVCCSGEPMVMQTTSVLLSQFICCILLYVFMEGHMLNACEYHHEQFTPLQNSTLIWVFNIRTCQSPFQSMGTDTEWHLSDYPINPLGKSW